MWLLDTIDLTLHEFFGDKIPKYAILSHRWDDDQVTFKDVLKCRATGLKGWDKITRFCAEVNSLGYSYAWADTCCIDKKSSAELSEAINSMYKWYEKSGVCITYLNDVDIDFEDDLGLSIDTQMRSSTWFTRGWTLQELVAPTSLIFYDAQWRRFGNRKGFKDSIRACGGVDVDQLPIFKPSAYGLVCYREIATRLKWASSRKTTREEDIAYCLLGLFQVNMPLLYGEGGINAFKRLQIEIMKGSCDHTIFLWNEKRSAALFPPLLADSPSKFSSWESGLHAFDLRLSYTPSNSSVDIRAPLRYFWPDGPYGPRLFEMCLNTQSWYSSEQSTSVVLFLVGETHRMHRIGPCYNRNPFVAPFCSCVRNTRDSKNVRNPHIGTMLIGITFTMSTFERSSAIRSMRHDQYKPPDKRIQVSHSSDCEWYSFMSTIRTHEANEEYALKVAKEMEKVILEKAAYTHEL